MPQHHVVVFGATSFVGQILTRYLFERHGAGRDLSWAIAGRSKAKLEEVRGALGAGASALPLIVADAADENALAAMCRDTRVVVSTVGPYALYGSPLVKACAAAGTDYCDLTGEVQWIRRMIDAHEPAAQASGARIVHCCGFDSLPSDLGVHFLQGLSRQKHGQPSTRVKLRVKVLKGGFSGGTAASLMNVVREAGRDPALRRELANAYSICPDRGQGRVRQPEVRFAHHDADIGTWSAPFVMAAINTRVVHRTNALLGDAYGRDFRYDEAVMTGPGPRGAAIAAAAGSGLGGFLVAAALPPTRWLLERYLIPKPGEGPSPEAQAAGRFDIRLFGTTADGKTVRAKVTGDRDPGYGSTAKMLGEAAVCMALDIGKPEKAGGFWTPATFFGDRLIARLRERAGLTFEDLSA